MNFEVYCYDEESRVINKEYFETYLDAVKYCQSEEAKFYDSTVITPMNYHAEIEMWSEKRAV